MKKLWTEKSKKLDKKALKFSSSIYFDQRLAKYDVRGSIAHAKMLGKRKIISDQEKKTLVKGLKKILSEIEKNRFIFDKSAEDIHTNIQNELEKIIGETAEKLHIARSRNDQICLDIRMYLKDEIKSLKLKIKDLQISILKSASKNKDIIIPGYTHLQHAQPILLAHQFLAYLEMLERDIERMSDTFKRIDFMPLGSGALAGTSLPIDRNYVAKVLGFSKICQNSIDAVSDRDFVVEVLGNLAILAMHLSRICEDLILWATFEFGFIELADEFSTGSSIMPQKKNPDILELIRANSGKIYGSLFSLLVVLKGLPLSYNRDLQLDKPFLFDSLDSIKDSLALLTKIFVNLKINKENIKKTLEDEGLFATDIAEYLVKKGLSWRKSHNLVAKLFNFCLKKNKKFSKLSLKEFKRFSKYFEEDIYGLFKPEESIKSKISLGGTSPLNVERQIKIWSKKLDA